MYRKGQVKTYRPACPSRNRPVRPLSELARERDADDIAGVIGGSDVRVTVLEGIAQTDVEVPVQQIQHTGMGTDKVVFTRARIEVVIAIGGTAASTESSRHHL